uniref:Homer scaffold protein 3b n=1 Tax=Astyanax mexicanus TaxID=7994 RepID=A0A3B1JB15_ASTMX
MEQPLFSAKAHVFQIDPATKRNWIPASKHAVTVSFFYDASRSVYRIISVGGTKAIINSTITPNMTFTKTSQKFGQWADSRANTVYGLGFATEQQLQQVNKFLCSLVSIQWRLSTHDCETMLSFFYPVCSVQFSDQFKELKEAARLVREKSQEKFELINTGLNIAAPQGLSEDRHSPPPLLCVNGPGEDKLFRSKSADIELASEKEHVKKMLSEGSVCEVNMETELLNLQESNAKLVAALHEANSSIDQWKKQLAEYQEETDRLREQVVELEAQSGHPASSEKRKEEISRSVEEMEALIKAKDEELEEKNADLEQQVQKAEQTLVSSLDARQQAESEVRKVIEVLDVKIVDLNDLRQSLAKLVDK